MQVFNYFVANLLGGFLFGLFYLASGRRVQVRVDLPMCGRCRVPEPERVDWDLLTLTFVVPSVWAEHLQALRDEAASSSGRP